MRIVSVIRGTELGIAFVSTYMVAVTMLQTSIFAQLRPWAMMVLWPIIAVLGMTPDLLDFLILTMVMMMSFLFWRRGDEAGFGRLFSLNMLLFFPAVLDFSMFNWVNLILPYEPSPLVQEYWVFGVGLILQATYVLLRYTVRFRLLRSEFEERGAEPADVDMVTKGQMSYLIILTLGTIVISIAVYYLTPLMRGAMSGEVTALPYPHVIIGIVGTLLIAGATIFYLRGGGRQPQRGVAGAGQPVTVGPSPPQPS